MKVKNKWIAKSISLKTKNLCIVKDKSGSKVIQFQSLIYKSEDIQPFFTCLKTSGIETFYFKNKEKFSVIIRSSDRSTSRSHNVCQIPTSLHQIPTSLWVKYPHLYLKYPHLFGEKFSNPTSQLSIHIPGSQFPHPS